MATSLVVKVVGDASSLERALRKSSSATRKFDKDISHTFRGVVAGSGAFRSLGRSIAFASAGFLGGVGLTALLRSGFDEFSNMTKSAAQTAAVLESTGGIAGVTAKHVEELGKQLLNVSGIDDEVVKSGENLLLTFRNVRNVVGAGNDIFDQATKAVLDMSVAMKEDVPSAAVRLGKALQDPIRGMTALRRVGVQFTQKQEALIKSLVKSGDVLGAQKVILRELQKEFGGSAEALGKTLPGQLNILKENVRNLAGEIAGELNPQLSKLTAQATAWIKNTQNQEKVKQAFESVVSSIGKVTGAIANVVDALGGIKSTLVIITGLWLGFKVKAIAATSAVVFANVAAAATVGAAWKAALISTGFGALAVLAGVAATEIIAHWTKVKVFFQLLWAGLKVEAIQAVADIIEPFTHIPLGMFDWARVLKNNLQGPLKDARDEAVRLNAELNKTSESTKGFVKAGKTVGDAIRAVAKRVSPDEGTRRRPQSGLTTDDKGLSEKDKRRLARQANAAARQEAIDRADLAVARAQATKGLADDLVALRKENALLLKRIGGSHSTIALERQQLDVQNQITSVLQQQAEARKAQEQARIQARSTRQFRRLGLGPGGEELVPGVNNLKRQLSSVTDAIEGSFLDTKKTRQRLRSIRAVLAAGVGNIAKDVRATIKQMIDDLNEKLKNASVDVTRFNKTASGQFVLAGAHGAGSHDIVIQGGVHLHGIQNMKQFEDEWNKRHKQRGHQRRSTR